MDMGLVAVAEIVVTHLIAEVGYYCSDAQLQKKAGVTSSYTVARYQSRVKCIVGPWTISMVSHKSLNYEKCHLGPQKSLKCNKCIYVTPPK